MQSLLLGCHDEAPSPQLVLWCLPLNGEQTLGHEARDWVPALGLLLISSGVQ